LASILTKQLLDNVLLQSGIPFETAKATQRSYTVIEKVLDSHLQATEEKATRRLKESSEEKPK
jgi:enterochelin esterase-like enzyme